MVNLHKISVVLVPNLLMYYLLPASVYFGAKSTGLIAQASGSILHGAGIGDFFGLFFAGWSYGM